MKIVSLTAENVKKLVAVQIKPDGNLVQICGKNGQGKTSVLDSIWWALTGTSHIQAAPIRAGANQARIRLDLGDLVVTRTFRRQEEGDATTSLTVENADGARYQSPQRMLDGLMGALTFDPLAFARMDPGAQVETLRRFLPGIDFEAIEQATKADYAARTETNREMKRARAAAEAIQIPDNLPDEPVNETALIQEMEDAGRHNTELEQRRARRAAAEQDADRLEREAAEHAARAEDLRRQAAAADETAAGSTAAAKTLRQRLADAGPLPAPIDTSTIRTRLTDAQWVNRGIASRQQRQQLEQQAEALKMKAESYTTAMAARDAERAKLIAEAEMPVPGLGFGEGTVTLHGLPFAQASDAEQLRASIAIAMAANPKLRVLRVRDGSLLDEDAMKLLAEMADSNDYQVWIERVDSSGKVGIVLEAGMVAGADPIEPAPEKPARRQAAAAKPAGALV